MSYPALAAIFLGVAVVVALLLAMATRSRPRGLAVLATVGVLAVLTAVFDSVMIAAGLFHYDPESLAGLHVGLAPVEDFAYPLATAILLPAVWVALRGRRGAPGRPPSRDDGPR